MRRSHQATGCSKRYGPLVLFVDLRYEPNRPITHMVIDDSELPKIWEEQFDGHDIEEGKRMLLQQARKVLEDQHRELPDPDDEFWKCSDEMGKPV